MSRLKVADPVFKYVEYLLYSYDEQRRLLKKLEQDVFQSIPAVAVGRVGGRSGPSDPTGNMVARLHNQRIAELRTRVEVIEATLKSSALFLKIYIYKYRMQLGLRDTLKALEMPERTFYRNRRQMIELLAVRLNLFIPESPEEFFNPNEQAAIAYRNGLSSGRTSREIGRDSNG